MSPDCDKVGKREGERDGINLCESAGSSADKRAVLLLSARKIFPGFCQTVNDRSFSGQLMVPDVE